MYDKKHNRKKEEVYLANCYKNPIKIKLTIVKQSQKYKFKNKFTISNT
jgi:hypothetical protein